MLFKMNRNTEKYKYDGLFNIAAWFPLNIMTSSSIKKQNDKMHRVTTVYYDHASVASLSLLLIFILTLILD